MQIHKSGDAERREDMLAEVVFQFLSLARVELFRLDNIFAIRLHQQGTNTVVTPPNNRDFPHLSISEADT